MSDGAVLQAKYELPGVTLMITPITILAQQALLAAAAARFPEPDRKPYEEEIEDAYGDHAQYTKAEDNAEWVALNKRREAFVNQAYIGLLIDTCVNVPDRVALCAPFKPVIDVFRASVATVPLGAALVSDFVAFLLGVQMTDKDVNEMMRIAQRITPLTGGELEGAYATFRGVELRRNGRTDGHQDAPSSDSAQTVKAQG